MPEKKIRDPKTPKAQENATPTEDQEPIRSSFSLDRYSREAIRRAASSDWYGTTQGEIVNLAPLLYAIGADLSLERRRKHLASIKTLVQQAVRSIRSIRSLAPHLGPALDYAEEAVEELEQLERAAIKHRDVHGVKQTHDRVCGMNRGWRLLEEYGEYRDYDYEFMPDPFLNTLQDLQQTANSDVAVDQGSDGQIDFRCCEGDREKDLCTRFGDYRAKAVIAGDLSLKEAEKEAEKEQKHWEEVGKNIKLPR